MASELRAHQLPRSFSVWLAALFLLLQSQQATAAPTAEDRETARSLMQQGDAAMDRGQYGEALRLFDAANAIMGVPTTALAVARAQQAMGLLVQARDTALAINRYPQSSAEPAPFVQARAAAAKLAAELATRIPAIRVLVAGLPRGATADLQMDGVPLPRATAELPRKVNPGRHVIRGAADSCAPALTSVVVAEGQATTAKLQFGCSVAQPVPVLAPRRRISAVTMVGLGTGLAAATAGTVTGILSLVRASDAKAACTGSLCPPSAEPDISASRGLATASNVCFAVAGTVVAASVIYWLLRDRPRRASTRDDSSVSTSLAPRPTGLWGQF